MIVRRATLIIEASGSSLRVFPSFLSKDFLCFLVDFTMTRPVDPIGNSLDEGAIESFCKKREK
jgi:hypothetical protein